MDRPIERIDTTDGLVAALADVGPGPLALDTEADSLHHYPEKVCLVQLGFGGRDLLVDPLAPDCRLEGLAPVLSDPAVQVILHGADYDVRMLDREFGLRIRGLFDTMIAARLAGERRFGLAALLETRFGVTLDKRYQRADWSRRPLPEAMERYAAMDTRYLEPLAGQLSARLEDLGRLDWAREEFERLETVRFASPDPAETARRVKGAGRLAPRALAVLEELVGVREEEARRCDRPPFRLMRDDVLVALAGARPRDDAGLAEAGVHESWRVGRRRDALLDAFERGEARPDAELPRRRRRRPPRPEPEVERRMERLKAGRDRIAAELDLEPSLIAPRDTLEAVARRLESGDDPGELPELRRWQWALLREADRP